MRIAELIGVRQLRLVEGDRPALRPGFVEVRVDAVGICGSDMHSYREGAVGDTPCQYPMVLGHEPAGTITGIGDGVTGWSAGELVALEPALYCYHCEFCHSGHHNVCANLRFMSQPDEPGFFRDYVTVPARNLIGLPPGVGAAEATLIEPLAVALHSLRFARVQPAETVAVFGAGPIGLLTIAALKLSGAGRIFAVEPLAHRRDLARAMGADAVIDASPEAAREILAGTGQRGVDCSIDCASQQNTANQCLIATRNAGRVVFTGIPAEVEVPLEFHVWRRKELALYQVRRSNHESDVARDLIAKHTAWFGGLVTHRRPLDEIGAAFAQVEAYADGVGKLVVTP